MLLWRKRCSKRLSMSRRLRIDQMGERELQRSFLRVLTTGHVGNELIRMRDLSEFGAVVSYCDLLKMWEKREGEGERAWNG